MALECPHCGSGNVIKRGRRKTGFGAKQRYMCKECSKRFVQDDGFKRMRHKPKLIVRALHMHNDGMSLSKVQNHLWQHDGVRVSRWAIAKWHRKYSIFLKYAKPRSHADHKRAHSLR